MKICKTCHNVVANTHKCKVKAKKCGHAWDYACCCNGAEPMEIQTRDVVTQMELNRSGLAEYISGFEYLQEG